jgi:hypothetical protein
VVDALFKVTDPIDHERIKRLTRHEDFQALVRQVEEAREEYVRNLARSLIHSPRPVSETDVEAKRHFWKGAVWALKTFPTLTAKDFDKATAEALKESEQVAS